MIRVLVVDDSALMRKLLTDILSSDPEVEVVGAARDPYVARDMIKQLEPHVLTLDVEMPRMDGITFLRNLMRLRPMPVVMISTRTSHGADTTLEALSIGAVDFVTKPESDVLNELPAYTEEIIGKVKAAARARVQRGTDRARVVRPVLPAPVVAPTRFTADAVLPRTSLPAPRHGASRATRVVAIGASTGGTEAIAEVVSGLPAGGPPVVIVQHMPPGFTARFAERLDLIAQVRVREARDGDRLEPGHVYIAPGQKHLLVHRGPGGLECQLSEGPPVNRHRPAVDVLFRSVAGAVGGAAVGVLLTGMGDDGARGLHELREAGAAIMVQDEATSVVWGMPGAAVRLGPVDDIVPIQAVAARIAERARRSAAA
jgi:two-component system chemotaxis response regulator CheB